MTNSFLSKALLVCLAQAGSAFFVMSASAQSTSEVGIGLGGLAPSYQFRNNRPAATVFYRRDISAPVTLRGALMGGLLRADDANVKGVNGGIAPLSAARQANMKGSLFEVSGALEYNFFDFHDRKEKVHLTPYVVIGLAAFYANTITQSTAAGSEGFNKKGSMLGLAIPAGFGIKWAMSRHWNLGIEAGARKAFTDELDHASTQTPILVNSHDQDWYFYNGVSISYTFYKIHCPDAYKGNRQLLQ
jgi:outer membrane scaffolding protein for murein synthesis (MipA/OmpV family)